METIVDPAAGPLRPRVSLNDKYEIIEGTAFMTGVQALVRLPIEQARRDRAAGLRTGFLISGYPGSPLGGYDLALGQASRFLDPLDIKLVPGLNEELAAAAVWGSQMIEIYGHARFDGVTGIWYGKSPGVDRCLDVFRHANFGGGPRDSGLIALAADDPNAKSSTLPNASEWDFVACGMPVLFPGTVQELLEYGLYAIGLARFTGLWPALKCVTNLCDGGASVHLSNELGRYRLPEIEGFNKPASFVFFAPHSIELERQLFEQRLPAATEFARLNRINRIVTRGQFDRVGLIAAGKTYTDLLQSLADSGLGQADLNHLGVRVLKVGMIYPLDPRVVREFADGLEEIVVVEEKRDLVETQVRSILYGRSGAPRVVGKRDEREQALFPWHGELDADIVTERIGPRLLRLGYHAGVSRRLEEIADVRSRQYEAFLRRLPNYCSGCPHSRSTLHVGDEVVGAGIGCHGMAPLQSQPERQADFAPPMGAEGSVWIGTQPWVDRNHMFQNLGDGTFFHSGSQSIRFCVAAGVNITFKLLYNRHVSMTGGQIPEGQMTVPQVCAYLRSEGVSKVIVVAEEPEVYEGVDLAGNPKVVGRDQYEAAVKELQQTPGTTVLIFDQECAAEKRRARKRGRLPEPDRHIFINEDVCEGCGDCGEVSNCMSVQPVETEFGRKTQVHQASCNQDYSCTRGNCPSFLAVYSTQGLRKRKVLAPDVEPGDLVEPSQRVAVGAGYRIYMPGIGGTGVVTANQILAYAAIAEGYDVMTLDQTGLAQKGGAVLSSLVIRPKSAEGLAHLSNKVGVGQADLLLALDALGAAAEVNADRAGPERTVIVADSTTIPTSEVIRHVNLMMPTAGAIARSLGRFSRAADNVWVDAGRVVEELFADNMLVNPFMIGAAYQAGWVPLRAESIEAAIRLNGVAVERNLQAFRYGRLYHSHPERVRALLNPPPPGYAEERERQAAGLGRNAAAYRALLDRCEPLSEESRRLLAIRIAELIRYQDVAYARRYVEFVLKVFDTDSRVMPGREELTRVAIRNLHRLMAYKDEYEVARLLTKPEWTARLEQTFIEPRVKVMLHPPVLKKLGLERKLELGGWFRPVLGLLARTKRLRGTPLDPFGRDRVRRVERELIGWYQAVLERILERLDARNYQVALQAASAADRIRGYDEVKLRNVERERGYVEERLAELQNTALAG